MDMRGTITRRTVTTVGAIALLVGLAGCDVTLTRDHSVASITRTCQGEPDHHGTGPVRTQVLVTTNQDETEDYDIKIWLNDVLKVSRDDVAPGNGVAYGDNVVNTTDIDITVAPSDGTGTTDTYNQIFNPC